MLVIVYSPRLGDLEVLDDVGGGVLPDYAEVNPCGIEYHYFRDAYFGHGFFESNAKGSVVGRVGGVDMYGGGWGGGGDNRG